MPVPDSTRVRYEVNPLDEVSCKLRFPRILSIDENMPAAFQDRVRGEYPHFQADSTVKLPVGLPESLAKAFQRDLALGAKKSYAFASANRSWTLKLTGDGLTLSSRSYSSWEDFRQRLATPFEALNQIYQPSFFTHVCVQYRNVIRRSQLGLESEPWLRLIQPRISGPLGDAALAEEVETMQARCVARLEGGVGKVDASYGLAMEEPTKEGVFLIDTHVYTGNQTERTDVLATLDIFNKEARRFFRWCITDRLHQALQPVDLSSATQ